MTVVVFAILALFAAYLAFDWFGGPENPTLDVGVPAFIMSVATIACFHRAVVSARDRLAWLIIGAAMLSNTAADVYWNSVIANMDDAPYPSVADFMYLAFYPLMFVGMTLLALRRAGGVRASVLLHGVIAVLTVAAIDSAVVFDLVNQTATGSGWEYATNLAYPLADVFVLAGVIGIWAIAGWRPAAAWWWIGGAMLLFVAGDAMFAYQTAKETFEMGTLVDLTWPLAVAMFFVAATRPGETAVTRISASNPLLFVPTAFFSTISVAILVWDHFDRLGTLAVVFATCAAAATIVQMGLALVENMRFVAHSEHEAMIDPVTQIANRRQLMKDLARVCQESSQARPALLALFDMNNFKAINDSFGHSEGDELLRRFAKVLADVAAGRGGAYRLGGDEFCLVLDGDLPFTRPLLERASELLVERREGVEVTSSFGYATLPGDTTEPLEALRIADRRMYELKKLIYGPTVVSARVAGPPADRRQARTA